MEIKENIYDCEVVYRLFGRVGVGIWYLDISYLEFEEKVV